MSGKNNKDNCRSSKTDKRSIIVYSWYWDLTVLFTSDFEANIHFFINSGNSSHA